MKSQRYVLASVGRKRELCKKFHYPCYWDKGQSGRQARGAGILDGPKKEQAVKRLSDNAVVFQHLIFVGRRKIWLERKQVL